MDERAMQFRVGVMVVAVAIIGVILVVLFDRPLLRPESYQVFITFERAPGVMQDTPVRKNGILIGRVADVVLRDDDVVVVARIDKTVNGNKVRLRKSDVCQISGTFLGDKSLEFVPGSARRGDRDPKEDDELTDGGTVAGIESVDPLEIIANLEGRLSNTVSAVGEASDEIGQLARRVNVLLDSNGEQFTRVVLKAEQTLENLNAAVQNADGLLGDEEMQANLKRVAADLPQALADIRETVTGLKGTFESVERNMKNFEGLTKPLGERGETLVQNIEGATSRLDELLEQLVVLTEQVNDPNNGLTRLLNDPELFEDVTETVRNIKLLSRKLEPILENAAIFTDKIARNPSSIIRQGTGIKNAGAIMRE